ncbi:hypothetical protein FS837_007923 [Tulasnella sp. UAMH 9824]|nr:hypothetical protein FS837_007923 [Tulasnella sp. UAMH 9824]
MPLASNVNVHVDGAELAPSHRATQRQPWLSEASRMNSQVVFNSIKDAILHGLELLSLYNKRAERELRARNNDRHDLATVSHVSELPLDLSLPRELVTGVMVLMPSVPRTSNGKQESREEARFPDVAIGLKDSEWKDHGVKLPAVPHEYLADTLAITKKSAVASGFVNYNILQNNGRNAHQVVDHVHVHVFPKPSASEKEGLVVGWPAEADDLKAMPRS